MKKKLLGLDINYISRHDLLNGLIEKATARKSSYLCAVNVHMTVESQKNIELKNAILNADWAVTDGVPVKWAFNYLNKSNQERLAGMDLTPELLKIVSNLGLVVSVYGNTAENLDMFKVSVTNTLPKLKIGCLISPPFRKLSKEETNSYIKEIKDSGTNILLVSLGCPKQEIWMSNNANYTNAVCLGIGNAINTIIGQEKRPPKLIQTIGMEWFYRLVQNPKRLFKRYLITNSKFCWLFIKNLRI
ncbi:WecB/TagA/CpsF family glycosyltransferase [Maribacter polysaccharolyticus]|uniref:WecB/TagA/CpsF family glycosyltransferase n=1 Tax=Maribacter polysaccharolyticus TaxID=3020831 RepID=UPI00237F6675|nr:WecB/TagA/CpsF family glycosyltransferase [Maribacter polysaccharolyticus]MDE3742226.1 WecB/TagA/CpsF family glycosyltransferase [Maribacter polysaccharolyticus]